MRNLEKKASKDTWGCVQLSNFSLRRKKKKKEISKHFDQISLNLTLMNHKRGSKKRIIDVFIEIFMIFFLFFFQQPWENPCRSFAQGYPQLCPVFPAAPQAPGQWAPAPSAQTQHQLHFLSPNCSELPENFLWSKKDSNAHRGFPFPPTAFGSTKQLNQHNLGGKKINPYNGGTLLFPALTPNEFYLTIIL